MGLLEVGLRNVNGYFNFRGVEGGCLSLNVVVGRTALSSPSVTRLILRAFSDHAIIEPPARVKHAWLAIRRRRCGGVLQNQTASQPATHRRRHLPSSPVQMADGLAPLLSSYPRHNQEPGSPSVRGGVSSILAPAFPLGRPLL